MATKKTQDIDLGIARFEYGDSSRVFRAVLTIETDKSDCGGIESDAKVMWHGDHSRQRMLGIGTNGGDFSRTLKRNPNVRATQKAIETQHAAVFTADVVDGIVYDAKEHYAEVVAAGVDGFKNTYPQAVTA